MKNKWLKYLLMAGCVYFCFMALAHFFSIKVPILFVYYDTPFYAYQDKIISFAVCAYVALFYFATKHLDVAFGAILVLALTVVGLSAVNLSSALQEVLQEGQSTFPYWVQTLAIAIYVVVLATLYKKEKRELRT